MEELDKRTKLTIMLAIAASMLFAALNQTIVGTALPRIIAELGGMEYYSWVFTAYMLTSSVTGLLVGKLSDMYGRKPFILTGLLFFMIGAFLSGTSTTITQLIIYRDIQGLGGGFIMSTAFTAVGDLFPPRERGKWQGLLSAIFGLASVIGPVLGGYIVDHMAWKWVFWVNLPIGIVAFLLIWRLFPKMNRGNVTKIDYVGAVFVTGILVPLLLAFSWAGSKYDWGSSTIISLLVASAVCLIIFMFVEKRAEAPVLPLSLFRNSIFNVSNIAGFMIGVAMFGSIMYIPLFVQGVIGTSASQSGLVTMPMMISLVVGSMICGQITSRTGRYKWLAVLGSAILCVGLYMLTLMDIHSTNAEASINMIIVGAGLGFTMPVFMLAVQNALPQNMMGVASASVQLFRQIGGTVGVSIMGTVLSNSIKDQMTAIMPPAVGKFLATPGIKEHAADLMNPQLLMAPDKLAEFRDKLPAPLHTVFDQLISTLQSAMAVGLGDVFKVAFYLAIAGLVLTLLLKEIPLRTSNREEAAKGVKAEPERS